MPIVYRTALSLIPLADAPETPYGLMDTPAHRAAATHPFRSVVIPPLGGVPAFALTATAGTLEENA